MIIQFDPSKMHVQVLCGIAEKYEPTESIQDIQKKVEELKLIMMKFRDEVLDPKLAEINKLVEAENKQYIPEALAK
jgi:hypothetical protein